MKKIIQPIVLLALIAIGFASATLIPPMMAHASAVTPDPVGDAQTSLDGVMTIVGTYGPVVGGMYLAYAIAAALLRRYKSSHWLAQGKRLAIATSVLGIVYAMLQVQTSGAPLTLVLTAGVAAAFKLLTPTVIGSPPQPAVPAVPAAPTLVGSGGGAGGGTILRIGMASLMLLSACGASARSTALKTAITTVTGAEQAVMTYDRTHQTEIASDPKLSPEQRHEALAAYRAKRDKVELAIDMAWRALGVAGPLADDTSMVNVRLAVAQVATVLAALLGGAP